MKQLEWMATFWQWENRREIWFRLMRRSLKQWKILSKQSALALRGAFASSRRTIPRRLCHSIPASEFVFPNKRLVS